MLSTADTQELTWWFDSPAPAQEAGRVVAQTYDPRGSGTYDPTTDYRLEHMVSAALARHQSEWSRVRRAFDRLLEAPDGRVHFEVLRRAFAPLPAHALSEKAFRWPEVAVVTHAALERAGVAAIEAEHVRLLDVAHRGALLDRCSPMSIACRVLEADRRLLAHGFIVTEDMVRAAVRRLLERAVKNLEVDVLDAVRAEMQRLVEAAGDAYRAARSDAGATKRAERAERKRANEAALDEALGKKRRKEAERFAAKIRRAS